VSPVRAPFNVSPPPPPMDSPGIAPVRTWIRTLVIVRRQLEAGHILLLAQNKNKLRFGRSTNIKPLTITGKIN